MTFHWTHLILEVKNIMFNLLKTKKNIIGQFLQCSVIHKLQSPDDL